MKNIILFGPPGVGKSTLIGLLKARGDRAIDLEDVYPSDIRFQLPNMLKDVTIGAADLSPKRIYPNAWKILLYLPEEKYQQRRANRDKTNPGKARQLRHAMRSWLAPQYDAILDVSGDISSTLANYDSIRSQLERRVLRERRGKLHDHEHFAPIGFQVSNDQE